jgi:hypothetical protein
MSGGRWEEAQLVESTTGISAFTEPADARDTVVYKAVEIDRAKWGFWLSTNCVLSQENVRGQSRFL